MLFFQDLKWLPTLLNSHCVVVITKAGKYLSAVGLKSVVQRHRNLYQEGKIRWPVNYRLLDSQRLNVSEIEMRWVRGSRMAASFIKAFPRNVWP